MKLSTDIKPRRDGTVTVQTPDGARYVFAANAQGELVCDVDKGAHIDFLLNAGYFFPSEADPADDGTGVDVIEGVIEAPKKRGRKKGEKPSEAEPADLAEDSGLIKGD